VVCLEYTRTARAHTNEQRSLVPTVPPEQCWCRMPSVTGVRVAGFGFSGFLWIYRETIQGEREEKAMARAGNA
jgi:hypothetical protein